MKRLLTVAMLCGLAACSSVANPTPPAASPGAVDRAFQEPGFAAYCAAHAGTGVCP